MNRRFLILLSLVLAGCLHGQTPTSTGATASQLTAETTARIAGDNANATAITNEATARTAGDATNAAAITAEATARANAITSEASTRAAADTTHTANIATNAAAITAETTRATNAEADLFSDLTDETTARVAGDTANANAITSEANARTSADTTHTADIATIAAAITAETTRATNAEADLASDLAAETTARTTAIASEASTRAAADTTHTADISANATAIANEITARIAADTTNANSITAEAATRASADTTHTADIATIAAAITAETTRATNAEADLENDLATEITRATTAEADLSAFVNGWAASFGGAISQLEATRAFEDGRTIDDTIIYQSSSGTIADLMSRQAKAIKQITGKANWLTTPVISLESVNTSLSDKQPLHPNLSAFAGLTNAADKMPYFTGSNGAATATVTSSGRNFLAQTDAAAQRAALALDAASSPTFSGLTVGGTGIFSDGSFDELSTAKGVFLGRPSAASTFESGRVMFANGAASQTWQVDNSAGRFRWFTPGVERMILQTSGVTSSLTITGGGGITLNSGGSSYFGGALGVGIGSPSAKVHALAATEQLRLGYDASNYVSWTVGNTGSLTIAPTGSTLTVTKDIVSNGTANRLPNQAAATGDAAMTRTLVRREIRTLDGMLADADAVVNADNYISHLAMGSSALGRASSPDSDGLINGWLSLHNDNTAYYSNQDGVYFIGSNTNAVACGVSLRPPTPNGNGIVQGDNGFRVNVACNLSLPAVYNDANTMVGREAFFGIGSLTTGSSAALTKGGAGIGFTHASDYIQFWNGTAWSDTSLRWKNGSTRLFGRVHAQLTSQNSQVVMQIKDSTSSTWITAGTVSGDQYGVTSVVIAHNVISGSPTAASSNNLLGVKNVSYATN